MAGKRIEIVTGLLSYQLHHFQGDRHAAGLQKRGPFLFQ
jgi:hypothetical protein